MVASEAVVAEAGRDFIRDIVAADVATKRTAEVVTRFPPEPNGYLHIGHAKSIGLNFGVAQEFGGRCHLRFDDTNPTKEEQEYIDAIERDVRWLGFDWNGHLYHASDYFERLYEWAEHLIRAGKAYVDDQSQDEIRAMRGTLTEPGRNSPFRDRTVEENLDLFRRMRAGEFPNGARVLRAKIDMASGNINLRDPVLYRILHASHPRTGDAWSIYPSYDFAHGQSDALEGITHSLCTLEFEDHRPLYDWFLDNLPVPSRPRQYEFARLNLSYTVLSKRVLTELVRGGHVAGWDDPRMPTLAGLRRRGIPPAAIRDFVRRVGVAKANSVVDIAMFDHAVREVLNRTAQRRMAVLRPLKIVIENYPEGTSEELEAVNHPDDPSAGMRRIRFGRELYVERDDFMENPPKKFYRLSPGREVRLRYAYFITCREAIKNAAGEVIELRCTYDPATRGGNAPDGRKVQATLHWVAAADALPAQVRLYNQLFTRPDPDAGDFVADLNPNSLEVLPEAKVEPALATTRKGDIVQFERLGYFCLDAESAPEPLVFNRTVGLRDTWAKVKQDLPAKLPSLRGRDSTIEFAERFAQAFPGARGVAWFLDTDTIKERLEKLLREPLVYADATPIWWWRGITNHQIASFKSVGNALYLMDGSELKIRRIAAVHPGQYYQSFVYVEMDPMQPTGLYANTNQRIAEVQRGAGILSYYSEEYGLVDGVQLVDRAQFDDGAATINGRLEDIRGRSALRERHVTPYNFVIAAQGSPVNNSKFDKRLGEMLDSMLKGADLLQDLSNEVRQLPKRP